MCNTGCGQRSLGATHHIINFDAFLLVSGFVNIVISVSDPDPVPHWIRIRDGHLDPDPGGLK
jgi:hypothetical protein